jgi:Zn-dependent peptidase ImmA (M78 family)
MSQLASGKAWAIRLTQILNKVPGIERFPVDVKALAQDYSRQCFSDPITMVKGERLDGFEGALYRSKGAKPMWSIVYNDSLSVPGRVNFVLAHEFGHYLRRDAMGSPGCGARKRCEPVCVVPSDADR